MVQGDEPLISPEAITNMLEYFNDPQVEIVNLMSSIYSKEDFEDYNNVKVVIKENNDALYFSREPIPSSWKGLDSLPMYMQVGVIAFRRDALARFNALKQTRLEIIESIDMNRVLETGGAIRMVKTEDFMIGVDTPGEALRAEEALKKNAFYKKYADKYK